MYVMYRISSAYLLPFAYVEFEKWSRLYKQVFLHKHHTAAFQNIGVCVALPPASASLLIGNFELFC